MNIFKRMKETAKPNSEKLTERRTKNERDERACRTERERERYTKWQRSVACCKVEHMSIRCRVFRENKEMLEKCTHSENRARGNTIDVDYVWKSTTHFDLKFKHSKSFLSFSLSRSLALVSLCRWPSSSFSSSWSKSTELCAIDAAIQTNSCILSSRNEIKYIQ